MYFHKVSLDIISVLIIIYYMIFTAFNNSYKFTQNHSKYFSGVAWGVAREKSMEVYFEET